MSFAEEKVKKYIKNNLVKFHRIHVLQMLDHLPCLTDVDKQQLNASVDRHGNNQTVWEFFDTLQRRQGWLQQLIRGLEETNLEDLAEDIQRVYKDYQVNPQSRPSATPAPLVAENGSQAQVAATERSDNHQRSPHNLLEPGLDHRPLSTGAPRPAISTTDPSLQEMGDYSTPIQETKRPSLSSEMAVNPKNTGNAQKPETSTPTEKKIEANSTCNDILDKQPDDRVTLAENTFCISPEQGQLGLEAMPKDKIADSRSSAVSTGPEHTASPNPRISENQPEENYYSSSDSSLLTSGSPDETQDRKSFREPNTRAQQPKIENHLRSRRPESSCREPHMVDNGGPVLQQDQFGVKQNKDLGAPSDTVCDVLKSPAEASDLSFRTTSKQETEEVTRPSKSNALDSSNEEDDMPCKPGTLTSVTDEIRRGLADQMLSVDATNQEYSGRSDRLRLSSEYSVGSDPLMVSDLSHNSMSEEKCSGPAVSMNLRRSETTGRTSPSFQSESGNHLDEGSIRLQIVQPPSVDLAGTPEAVDFPPSSPSLHALFYSVPDHKSVSSFNSCPENSDIAHSNKKVADETPPLLSNPIWPAVGFALACGVLVLLRWLKK